MTHPGSPPSTVTPRLVLASQSPARLSTLRQAGLDPEVVVSGVDESTVQDRDAGLVASRLAELKAQAVVARLTADHRADALVLGCDSVLDFEGEVLGKPHDEAEARLRWQRMSGRSGVLRTGHCLVDLGSARQLSRTVSTVVHFAQVEPAEIEAYLASGEPLAVAGAFTLDGLGGAFVRAIEGDPHNVVGVSLPTLREMLAVLGVRWTDLWV